MVVDYCALNKQTVKNHYPLPRIDDLFDQLTSFIIFLSLDLAQCYHRTRIFEEDTPKMAFQTLFGHYQFKVLSFGLTNAPATFHGVMNRVFSQGHRKVCLSIYLDDILIFSKNEEERVSHLAQVLQILQGN